MIAVPEIPTPDLRIWLGLMPPWLSRIPDPLHTVWHTSPYQDEDGKPTLIIWQLTAPDGLYFRFVYTDGTEFLVDKIGSTVWATWHAPLTLEDTCIYLLGPVLGALLRLRGMTCLHASAIAMGEQAIALLGPEGAGKSTTAAAFAQRGYLVLSDDIVTLDDQGTAFLVHPGYPYLRLWPESVNLLYGSPDALPRLLPTWDKLYLDLTDKDHRLNQDPLPLSAIYILGDRSTDPSAPMIEAVTAGESLMALVANTFANLLLDKGMRSQEFDVLSRVVKRVRLRRVHSHTDPAFLAKLCDIIIDDFQSALAG